MNTLIIGLGNPIVGDDAIGIKIVEYLSDTYTFSSTVEILVDVSLAGLSLVELFQGYDKVIIVDSMQSGQFDVGKVVKLNPSNFESSMHISDYHNLDFFTALDWARQTFDGIPDDENIIIMGIEINYVQEFSDVLTPELDEKFNEIANHVYRKIKKILNEEIISNVL